MTFKSLTDEDLLGVAGSISGRQVFSACAGLMMLMGVSPFENPHIHAMSMSLQTAAKEENFEEMKASFEENHDSINEEYRLGLTALHYVVKNRDFDKVRYLVENGADVMHGALKIGVTSVKIKIMSSCKHS